MTAMLQALEPKTTVDKGQALNPKLAALLHHRRSEAEEKISRRLARAEKKREVETKE
jgi:ribose 1,5-bisphosphokinase PhnN